MCGFRIEKVDEHHFPRASGRRILGGGLFFAEVMMVSEEVRTELVGKRFPPKGQCSLLRLRITLVCAKCYTAQSDERLHQFGTF